MNDHLKTVLILLGIILATMTLIFFGLLFPIIFIWTFSALFVAIGIAYTYMLIYDSIKK